MRYLRICLMFSLFLLLCSPAGFAADDSRYENIVVNDVIIAQFDKETLQYQKDPYHNALLISVWIKTYPDPNSTSYDLNHYLLQPQERKMLHMDWVECYGSGKIRQELHNTYDPAHWSEIVPATNQDSWYMAVSAYVKDHQSELQNTYDEKYKKTKKRTPFSILNDIYSIGSQNDPNFDN